MTPSISINPAICAGTPCFAGARIHADLPARVLAQQGETVAWILANYPTLTEAHVELSLWYASIYGGKKLRKAVKAWWKLSRGTKFSRDTNRD